MAIRSNGGYNNEALGQAAANIAEMFAPPSGSDLAGYSVARKNNQQADIVAQLNANPEYQSFDHQAILGDLYDWTGSERKILMDDATNRRGQDVGAQTSRANNLLDNQTRLALPMISPRDPTHTAAGVTPELADFFSMPEIPGFVGAPAPLSETQWKAGQLQELKQNGEFSTEELLGLVTGDSASQEKIARLTQNFLDTGLTQDPAEARNLAIGIADGRYKDTRDPITGEVQVVDIATGRPAYQQPVADSVTGDPALDLITPPSPYGAPYPASNQSFGVGGAAAGAINTVTDTLGLGTAYPEIQQTQADFGVLKESLLNDIQSAYGRQPPSWLLQRIDGLTPDTGNPFEGVGQAQAELTSLGRSLTNELELARQALETRLSPTVQQETQARVLGLENSLARINQVLGSFGAGDAASQQAAPDADGWVTAPNGARIREIQ